MSRFTICFPIFCQFLISHKKNKKTKHNCLDARVCNTFNSILAVFVHVYEMSCLRYSKIIFLFRLMLTLSLQMASKGLAHNNPSVLCFWSLTVSTDSPVGCCSLPGRSWDSAGGLLKHWEPCLKRQATR